MRSFGLLAPVRSAAGLVLAVLAVLAAAGAASAGPDPRQDLAAANAAVGQALAKAGSGDLAGAERDYRAFESTWSDIEEGIRGVSLDAYRVIEARMVDVDAAFRAKPADRAAVTAALTALERTNEQFIRGEAIVAPVTPAAAGAQRPTVAALLEQLASVKGALARPDLAAAAAGLVSFRTTWLDVEGDIKTRSPEAYRDTERDMALAFAQATQGSPDALATVERMAARLVPFREASRYGIFDASIILLREGLEALLVIVALSTFLVRSGNAGQRGWVWSGAAAGIAASVALGVALQVVLASFIRGGDRELIEGVTGLFAAAMLLYVGYWLHSRSSLGAWQSYLRERTATALTRGGLLGLGALAFLAVFREGAETVLFYLGMAANITTSDLLIGLAIGASGLVVLGALMTFAGLRIPMRPFFRAASVLVFYLCFKFIGSGIHALEVSGVLSAGSAAYLPQIDVLGVFPTWASTIPQMLLLLAAGLLLIRERTARITAELARTGTDGEMPR